jgi:histidine triad (HIT) family protein
MDCIFCKISSHEIPAVSIYEDNDFFAFMDINPVAKGHALLIPKVHSKWMHETEDSIVSSIFVVAKKLMNQIRTGLPCDYVQISVVGEEVGHFHIHLIPRYLGDEIVTWKHVTYESIQEIEEYAHKIKK